ncbi:hypothetical protein G6F16_007736 [Rhizopus arrhizus]|nr:hypothetical protein G6F17_007410 [Rhizopus arrhizus]KAG0868835.1 hypothetical protein G6F16_007736 [Rhizopus arrhizus]
MRSIVLSCLPASSHMSPIEENIETSRRNNEAPTSSQNSPTNVQTSLDFPELTTVSTPWRNPEQVSRLKEGLLQKQQQRRQQRQEAAARLLQPLSENQGFQYLYLPTKARVPVGQLRSRLRKLDINNNRILDIHYPDRNVVALLVHNDYADELRSHLRKFKVTLKDDFDPCDPMILRDPIDASIPANTYVVAQNEWTDGSRLDVVYASPIKTTESLPPILIELQYQVDQDFMLRLIKYASHTFKRYKVLPIILVIVTKSFSSADFQREFTISRNGLLLEASCKFWAKQCVLLTANAVSNNLNKGTLDPMIALGLFLTRHGLG